MDHCAVTTFSPSGYELYGRRMLQSFSQHWTIPLFSFHESSPPDVESVFVEPMNLDEDEDRRVFYANNPRRRVPWHMDKWRFGHKVFALTTPRRPEVKWWIWMDADVLWHSDVTSDDLDRLCPSDSVLTFLGRRRCRFPELRIPECGFVAYRVEDIRVASLLDDMRHVWVSGEIDKLPQRHDSYVFWHCLKRSGIKYSECFDLTPRERELHVWPRSLLSAYGTHQKGPVRKREVYG